MRQCGYCKRERAIPCMSTREMEDNARDPVCTSQLMALGGGEYTENQRRAAAMDHNPPCPVCHDSGRPGFVVFATYRDRLMPTDVVGEYRLTSGTDWCRCYHCRGTGRQEPPVNQ